MFSQSVEKHVHRNAPALSGMAQDYTLFKIKRMSHFLSVKRDWKGTKTKKEFCSVYHKH